MSKYPIHPDFMPYEKIKMPLNPLMLKVMNGMMRQYIGGIKPPENMMETKYKIKSTGKGSVAFSIIEPKETKGPLPCMIYLHGGAFVIAAAPHHKSVAIQYADKTPCKVVMVDYPLAPDQPYPVGLMDSYQVLEWVYAHRLELGIDGKRIAVGGDSAGGAIAAGLCQLSKERQGPGICFQLLLYPVTDSRQITESIQKYTDTPLWNSVLNRKMWQMYLGNAKDKKYASPIEAEDMTGFPKTYIEVAEFDCLRDEGLAYGVVLEKAGVQVEIHETLGTVHGFDVAEKSQIVRESVGRRINAIKRAFQQ